MIMTTAEVEEVEKKDPVVNDVGLMSCVDLKENVDFDRELLITDEKNLLNQIDTDVSLPLNEEKTLDDEPKEIKIPDIDANHDDNNNDGKDSIFGNCDMETNCSMEIKDASTSTMKFSFEEKSIQVEDQTKTELILKVTKISLILL